MIRIEVYSLVGVRSQLLLISPNQKKQTNNVLGFIMRIHKLAFGLATPLLLAACGEYVDKIADNVNDDLTTLKNKIENSCVNNSEGDIWFSSKDQSYYVCTNGNWVQTQVSTTPSENYGVITPPQNDTVYQYIDNYFPIFIPKDCDANGDKYKVTKDWGVYQCFDGDWILVHEDWESVITSSSSNTWPIYSSSSYGNFLGTPLYLKKSLWSGNEGIYQIDTELDAGYETSGYWYVSDDHADGGKSFIEWPAPLGNEYSEEAMDNIIDYCGGICGTANLSVGTLTFNPYVAVAFDLAGIDDNEEKVQADASDWGGICVTYSSERALSIEMSFGDKEDAYYGYDVPFVNLPKATEGTQKCFEWSKFKQAGWANAKITGDEGSKKLATLKFKIQGTNGTTSKFNIMSVGRYKDSIEPAKKTFSWAGYTGEYQVNTGLDVGTETSGYWFSFSDDDDGGASYIKWPVELGNYYSNDAFDPVIDHCGGVCGTFVLDKGTLDYNPYVGVGFNVAGEDEKGNIVTADASDWGGICLTYTTDAPSSLYMGLGEYYDATLGYDTPFVSLPKAAAATSKCFEWSKFKQAGWGSAKITGVEAAKILASVRFQVQGASGIAGQFNIMEISSYYK